MKLTVQIAAQQLQPQGRLLLEVHRLKPDVASHKWWGEAVVFHLGAVHVAIKYLKHIIIKPYRLISWLPIQLTCRVLKLT